MKMTQIEKVKERTTNVLLVGILLVVIGFIGMNTGRAVVVWGLRPFFRADALAAGRAANS